MENKPTNSDTGGALRQIKKILQHDATDPTKRMKATVKKGNMGFMSDDELKPNKTGSSATTGIQRSRKPLKYTSTD